MESPLKLSSPSKSSLSSPDNRERNAGSATCPYKLLIVGGGPSGCSIIVRANRLGFISELCSFQYDERDSKKAIGAGVCLMDSGTIQRFGGGTLQDYAINSNTYVNKFVSNVCEEKPDNLPPEKVKGTSLERLAKNLSAQELERQGNRTGSLLKVGVFLRDVGQTVYNTFQQFPESSKCMTETTVKSLHRIIDENGKFSKWKILYCQNSSPNQIQEIYSKHVVMCTGGHQDLPVFTNPQYRSKVLTSDFVCTTEGIQEIRNRLMKNTSNTNGMGRVVIIGGSHSAFSSAWICLNKLEEDINLSRKYLAPSTATSDLNGHNNDPNHPGGFSSTASTTISSTTPVVPNTTTTAAAVLAAAMTTGSSNGHHGKDSKDSKDPASKLKFGTSGICILYRSSIKVFYATKAEADHDNYTDICINKVTGQINPFGGIRGDAKELWRSVRSQKELRIRLLQIKSNIGISSAPNNNNTNSFGGMKQSIVDKVLEDAVVIVWACGYSANMIPVYDANNQLITLSKSKGQVDVDEAARILTDENYRLYSGMSTIPDLMITASRGYTIVENLYGSGLGYGLKATLDNGELDGSSGRADGVAVYLKRGATLVLAHVLGNRVFGGMGIKSWEERNMMIRRQNATSAGSNSTAPSSSSGSSTSPELTLHKSLASPKRPGTSSFSSNNSVVSTARSLASRQSTTNNHRERLSKSNPRGTTNSNPLNKSCPESVVRKATASSATRPATQYTAMRKSFEGTVPSLGSTSNNNNNNKRAELSARPVSTGRALRDANRFHLSSTSDLPQPKEILPSQLMVLSSTMPLSSQLSSPNKSPRSQQQQLQRFSPSAASPSKLSSPSGKPPLLSPMKSNSPAPTAVTSSSSSNSQPNSARKNSGSLYLSPQKASSLQQGQGQGQAGSGGSNRQSPAAVHLSPFSEAKKSPAQQQQPLQQQRTPEKFSLKSPGYLPFPAQVMKSSPLATERQSLV